MTCSHPLQVISLYSLRLEQAFVLSVLTGPITVLHSLSANVRALSDAQTFCLLVSLTLYV